MDGPRAVKKHELRSVIGLANSVFRPVKRSMGKEYHAIFNDKNLSGLRIISEDGKPVSLAGIKERNILICGCRIKIACIGAVCTAPEFRNKGYASVLFNDCLKKAENDGCDFLFVSGYRSLYDRMDCMRIGRICNYAITKNDLLKFGVKEGISVGQFLKKDLPFMRKAYNKKNVRYARSKKDWDTSIKCGQAMDRKATFVVLEAKGRSVAYLALNLFKEGDSDIAEVPEYAGESALIAEALPAVFKKFGLDRMVFNIPVEERYFIAGMKDKDLNVVLKPMPGTVRLVDFSGFMEKMKPYFMKKANVMEYLKCREDQGRFVFELGRERLVINNRRIMTGIIFGSPDSIRMEVTGSEGLTGLFNDIFPLQFPWPGLDNV